MLNQGSLQAQIVDAGFYNIAYSSPILNKGGHSTLLDASKNIVKDIICNKKSNAAVRIECSAGSQWLITIHFADDVDPGFAKFNPHMPKTEWFDLNVPSFITEIHEKNFRLQQTSFSMVYGYDESHDQSFVVGILQSIFSRDLDNDIYDAIEKGEIPEIYLIDPPKSIIDSNSNMIYPEKWFDNLTELSSESSVARSSEQGSPFIYINSKYTYIEP